MLAYFMLSQQYKVGLVLRMIKKECLKQVQKKIRRNTEFQTFRLFAILGLLTLIFVLVVRLVQNGPNFSPRTPATVLESNTASK